MVAKEKEDEEGEESVEDFIPSRTVPLSTHRWTMNAIDKRRDLYRVGTRNTSLSVSIASPPPAIRPPWYIYAVIITRGANLTRILSVNNGI